MLLLMIGTCAGLAYAILGIVAERHRKDAAASSDVNRYINWSLWWFIERDQYDTRGRRLCSAGAVIAMVCVAAWVLWFLQKSA